MLRIKFRKADKGFSLIELLLYMGIFSILMLVLFQLLTSIFDLQLESESAGSVSQDGRFIVNRLNYDIMRSATISAPLVGQSGQSLTVKIDATHISTYSASSGNLLLNVAIGDSQQLNSTDTTISNLNFYHLSDNNHKNDTIMVSFTLKSKVVRRGAPNSLDFKTTVGLRAP